MWWMVAFSFCTSVVVIPLIILMCRHFGWYDTTNERKIHKGNIPRLGGLGIIIAFTLSTVIYFTVSKSNSITHVLPIIIAGLIIFTVALLDDFLNLKAKLKLLFQIIATVIVLYFDFRFKKIFNFELFSFE